jgi:uncharacterized protein YbjT (DUF2867 family)
MSSTQDSQAAGNGKKPILVIGGTGVVGAPMVRQLDRADWSVRVTSRNASQARDRLGPRVELVQGDANRPEDMKRAMTGCRAVLICVSDLLDPYLDLRLTRTVVMLAPGLGIERVGLISGPSVARERRYFPMIDAKFQAEEHLKTGSVPWVIIRPTWPMESLARFVQGNRASVLGRQPAVIHPVAGDDMGRMVRRAFELDEAAGRTLTIHGPEAFTMKQWLGSYCALVRPQASVKNVPFWVLSLVALLTANRTLKAAIALMKYFENLPEFGDPEEANRILGAPTITLEQWAASRKAGEQCRQHETVRATERQK